MPPEAEYPRLKIPSKEFCAQEFYVLKNIHQPQSGLISWNGGLAQTTEIVTNNDITFVNTNIFGLDLKTIWREKSIFLYSLYLMPHMQSTADNVFRTKFSLGL